MNDGTLLEIADAVVLEMPSLSWLSVEHRLSAWGGLVHVFGTEFEHTQRQILRDHPLLSRIVVRLIPAFTERTPTFCVREDGVLFINPGLWMKLVDGERRWIVGFATMTLAFGQHERGRGRVAARWSEACARVNERILGELSGMEAPAVWRRRPGRQMRSDVEEYDLIPPSEDMDVRIPGYGFSASRGMLVATSAALRKQRDGAMQRWAGLWKIGLDAARGRLPMGVARMVDQLRGSGRVDWRARLARAVRRSTGRERQTTRPDRRLLGLGAAMAAHHEVPIFPGWEAARGEVLVIVDTSGSMGSDQLGIVLREVATLLRQHRAAVRVLTCDAEVHWEGEVRDAGAIELIGGGGSSMVPAFDRAAQLRPPPALIVVCSDLDVEYPPADCRPAADIYWLVPVRNLEFPLLRPPFGDVIEVLAE